LVMCLFYHVITKSKDQHTLSFAMIIYAAVLTVVSVIVEPKKQPNQYAWSVVSLNVISLFAGHSKAAPLFLGAAPVLINWSKQQLKK